MGELEETAVRESWANFSRGHGFEDATVFVRAGNQGGRYRLLRRTSVRAGPESLLLRVDVHPIQAWLLGWCWWGREFRVSVNGISGKESGKALCWAYESGKLGERGVESCR